MHGMHVVFVVYVRNVACVKHEMHMTSGLCDVAGEVV